MGDPEISQTLDLPGLVVVDAGIQATFCPVESHRIAFIRHKGVQRIAHHHPVVVLNLGSHGIPDVNFLPEDAGIPYVAVCGFGFYV